MGEKNEDYENRFTYHPVKDGQAEKYGIIRERAKDYAYLLDALDVPASREKSLALTALEEAVFWANAAVARNG